MVCINASESNECFRNERQLFDESAVLCWNRCPLNSVGSLRQVACSWRALAAAEALLRSSLRLWASVPPAGRRPRPQLRLAPCWAPCRPSCRLAAAQSRVLHGASYSGALASGHPRHTLLSSCPGGGSATGLCHHIWCPRCFRVFCRPGARC